VKFLVDNQLPPALARFISQDLHGEALHVSDIGLRCGSDAEVWTFAAENDLVLISKDEDFAALYSKKPRPGCFGSGSAIAGGSLY
jgi:predicted nuclease of predicted toxin-antitoxin system